MYRYILFLLLTVTSLIGSAGFAGHILAAAVQASDSNNNSDNTSTGESTDLTPDRFQIGSNENTRMNQEFYLRFEPILGAIDYQLQIAKYSDFKNIVIDTGPFLPKSPTSPGFFFPADLIDGGYTYYWRVRATLVTAEPPVFSTWSEVKSITVKSGVIVDGWDFGPQLLDPYNGEGGTRINPTTFTWAPYKGSTKYRFELGRNTSMTNAIVNVIVESNTYTYQGELEYDHQYFWRVTALEPVASEWMTFSFITERNPNEAKEPAHQPTPLWVWPVISIGTIIIIAVIVIIVNRRR